MLLHIHNYDSSHDPAMPKIQASLAASAGGKVWPIEMIVDSGADATMLPTATLKMMGAIKTGRVK